MVLNLIDPSTAGELVAEVERAAAAAGGPRPRVAVWAPAAIWPDDAGPATGRAAVDQGCAGVWSGTWPRPGTGHVRQGRLR